MSFPTDFDIKNFFNYFSMLWSPSAEIQDGHHQHISHHRFWTIALVADGELVLYISRPKLFRNKIIGGHWTILVNLRVLDREQDRMRRKAKEAIHIKQRAPSMNLVQGYQVPPIYGQIIPRPPSEPNHSPWSLRDQDLLKAGRNVAIVSKVQRE